VLHSKRDLFNFYISYSLPNGSPRALSQKSAQQSPNIFKAERRSATRSAPRRTQPHSQVGWPQFEHSTISRIDSNDTNGWIVSPAPPSPAKGTPSSNSNALNLATNNCNLSPARYTRGWPRVFLEKPLTIPLMCKPIVRNARSVSPKDSSSDEGRAPSPKPAKKVCRMPELLLLLLYMIKYCENYGGQYLYAKGYGRSWI
jgi:hypothetical protein